MLVIDVIYIFLIVTVNVQANGVWNRDEC